MTRRKEKDGNEDVLTNLFSLPFLYQKAKGISSSTSKSLLIMLYIIILIIFASRAWTLPIWLHSYKSKFSDVCGSWKKFDEFLLTSFLQLWQCFLSFLLVFNPDLLLDTIKVFIAKIYKTWSVFVVLLSQVTFIARLFKDLNLNHLTKVMWRNFKGFNYQLEYVYNFFFADIRIILVSDIKSI